MELYAKVKVKFASEALCEKAITYLNHEGPEDEDDVPKGDFPMWDSLQESLPIPRSEEALGDGWLRVNFDMLWPHGGAHGEFFLNCWYQAGVQHGYVLLSHDWDDLWRIDGPHLELLLESESLYEPELAPILNQFKATVERHGGDKFAGYIELYESGVLGPTTGFRQASRGGTVFRALQRASARLLPGVRRPDRERRRRFRAVRREMKRFLKLAKKEFR